VSRNSDSSHNSRAGHPPPPQRGCRVGDAGAGCVARRLHTPEYSRHARSSRLAIRAPRSGTYATNHCYGTLEAVRHAELHDARLLGLTVIGTSRIVPEYDASSCQWSERRLNTEMSMLLYV